MKRLCTILCLLAMLLLALALSSCGSDTPKSDTNVPTENGGENPIPNEEEKDPAQSNDSYTVVFKDDTGALLKTETVREGGAATPPTPPLREDLVFEGWDTDFACVTSDLTVTALYREKKTFTVTFLDYSGRKLSAVSVKEGADAVPPADPTREGYQFAGWEGSLTDVREDRSLFATYTLTPADNVFDISYEKGLGNAVTLTVSLTGRVHLAGATGKLVLPSGVTDVQVEELGSTAANHLLSNVYFLYVNAEDVTLPTTLFSLSFESEAEALTFKLVIDDVFDEDENSLPYTVIGEELILK